MKSFTIIPDLPRNERATIGVSAETESLIHQEEVARDHLAQVAKEAIRLAKEQNASKEPFDISALSELYDLSTDSGEKILTQARIDRLEALYYLDTPTIQSLSEFAAHLRLLDEESGG